MANLFCGQVAIGNLAILPKRSSFDELLNLELPNRQSLELRSGKQPDGRVGLKKNALYLHVNRGLDAEMRIVVANHLGGYKNRTIEEL